MRPDKGWAYLEYRRAFRLMRRGFSYKTLWDSGEHCSYVLKAADYSYQAYGYDLSGWTNAARRKRFNAIKWRIGTKRLAPENNPPPIQIDLDRW